MKLQKGVFLFYSLTFYTMFQQLSLFADPSLDYETPASSETFQRSEKPQQDLVKKCSSDYQARIFYDVPQPPIGSKSERKRKNQRALASSNPVFIYQNYTGIGGLHGIAFNDFRNFHDYTKAKQEFEMGQFFTPSDTARLVIEMLEIEDGKQVADICCGMGQFFNYLKGCKMYGVEIDENACEVAQKLYPNAKIQPMDMRYMKNIPLQDYIVGNPPFNLVWEDEKNPLHSSAGKVVSQDYYVYQCYQFLKDGGFMAFICPTTWLEDELRCGKVKEFLAEHFVQVFEIYLPDDHFRNVGVKNFSTKILGFQKKIPDQELPYRLFTARYADVLEQWRGSETYQQFLGNKFHAFQYQAKQKYLYYFRERADIDQEKQQEHRYKKLLYELKRVSPELLEKAEQKRREIETAVKPEYMDWEEWCEKRPTLPKLLCRMRRWLSKRKPSDTIRLVKTKSYIKLKGYSRNAIGALRQMGIPTQWSRNKLINREYWQEEWQSFQQALEKVANFPIYYRTKKVHIPIQFHNFSARTFLRKKTAKTQRLQADISSLAIPSDIQKKLESLELGEKKLLPHQVEDVARALQKPAALLNWEMGTGKTLSAIAWSKIKEGLTLVVAPSILIRKTWQEELQGIGETQYQIIEKIHDMEHCSQKQYMLISLERLPKYYKRLKKIRFRNLIVDESDNIKNRSSQRAKAVKAVAKRIKNKLILTGTFVRNNAVEAYNQLELLLNNSPAMLCEVSEIEEYDRGEKEYVKKSNPIYQLPYPAYGGHAIFRKNFSPKKTTVFGASKTNQELYNKTALEKLLKSVRLRRRFQEVKPKEVSYDIQQITVPMTHAEIQVYEYIFDEFVQVVQKMYETDHDGKVAKMLVIMRQITALLQGVSHPWTFPQYQGPEITSKMGKVIEMIQANPGKKIMFGSPWKATSQKYAEVLAREFPIIHLESDISITKRNQLIREFREGNSQILISTIGVLKAGVNIPEAEIVIIDSYPWNYAQLSQYFFRAIRLNAKNHTQVYCLSNEGSFDTNVFNLMLAKERVNKFIQDGEEVDAGTIASNFGVDEDMLKCAIQMTKKKMDGKTCSKVAWGESTLSDETARAES